MRLPQTYSRGVEVHDFPVSVALSYWLRDVANLDSPLYQLGIAQALWEVKPRTSDPLGDAVDTRQSWMAWHAMCAERYDQRLRLRPAARETFDRLLRDHWNGTWNELVQTARILGDDE